MGVYLSTPITEKVSCDRKCSKFTYGASSMQGWRMSQEDAHNCVPEFEEDTSLFAVYDGHGGAEVAQYCAIHLPEFIKQTAAYLDGRIDQGLEDAFLGFDETLTKPHVIRELKLLAGVDEDIDEKEAGVVPASRNERDMLLAEANMPLEDVLAQYDGAPPSANNKLLDVKNSKQSFQSPMIRPKGKPLKDRGGGDSSVVSSEADSTKSSQGEENKSARISLDSKLANGHADNDNNLNIEKEISQSSPSSSRVMDESGSGVSESNSVKHKVSEREEQSLPTSTTDQDGRNCQKSDQQGLGSSDVNNSAPSSSTCDSLPSSSGSTQHTNPPGSSTDPGPSSSSKDPSPSSPGSSQDPKPSSSLNQESEALSISNDTPATSSPSGSSKHPDPSSSSTLEPKEPGASSSGSISDPGIVSTSSDDPLEGGSSAEPVAGSSSGLSRMLDDDSDDDDDYDSEDAEDGSSDEDDGDEGDSDDESDDEELQEIEGLSKGNMMAKHEEEPGSDSGCTAVVAVLKGRQLVVANAGDSRCVLCRDGNAVDLSFDHKPEDSPEQERIEKAGGKVTMDGRVNGGLNLSRAIGDHFYKRNSDLPAKDQMITAFPDIQSTTIGREDEFVVLACDGIWNYMNSQEVVDFVKKRLSNPAYKENPSKICEEMFDHCLAPNTMGDGTGCDNMTCIVILLADEFRKAGPFVAELEPVKSGNSSLKRDASELDDNQNDSPEEAQAEKKQKLSESENADVGEDCSSKESADSKRQTESSDSSSDTKDIANVLIQSTTSEGETSSEQQMEADNT